MGTWGAGILQNDAAQDGLMEAAGEVERSLVPLLGSDEAWPQVLAGVGVLAQFSPYSLSTDGPFRAVLAGGLRCRRPEAETATLSAFLDALAGDGDLPYEMRAFPPELAKALHGPNATTFPMQKTWAKAPGMFRPPSESSISPTSCRCSCREHGRGLRRRDVDRRSLSREHRDW